MPVSISAEIEGVSELNRRLLIMSDGVKDFTEPLTASVSEVKRSIDLNFDAAGAVFESGGWMPRKIMYAWPILNKTGKMKSSFTDTVGREQATIGNSADYFKYHQSNQARKKIPRRVMLKLDNERKEFIQKQFQAYIIKLTRGQR